MKRLFPFILFILLVLGGLYALVTFLNPERHRQEISSAISTALNHPVVIGPLSMSYLPPALHVDQIGIMDSGGNPIMQVASSVAPLDWQSLLHLKLAPQAIELRQWRLDIQRKADGSWDFESLLPKTSGLANAEAWALREVRWQNGEIHGFDKFAGAAEIVIGSVEGHWEPRPQTVDFQGTFSSVIPGTRVTFTAKGQFFGSPQWSGDLQLSDQANTAVFHMTDSPAPVLASADKNYEASSLLDIKGQSTKWSFTNVVTLLRFYCRLAPIAVDNNASAAFESWQFHANVHKSSVFFDHSAGVGGGLTEAKGWVIRSSTGAVLSGEMAAKDVPIESLFKLAGVHVPLDGKVTMLIKGFQASLSYQLPSTVACEGSLELKDGTYVVPEKAVKKLAKAKTLAYIKQKFPDYAAKGVPITKLSARWKAKNGIATVDNARLVSTDVKAGYAGKVDISKEGLDGYVRLDIHEKDPKKARLIPLKYHTQPAYGRLIGTVSDWQLRALPASRIPAAVQSKLR